MERSKSLTFGNQVTIGYATANQWTISDSTGRTHRVLFRTDLPGFAQTVSEVDVAGFGGIPATYAFHYTTATTARPYPNDDNLMLSSTVTVPLLYAFPIQSSKYLHRQQAPGIATRTEKDATGAVLGTWSYATSLTPGNRELVNSVTDPLGNRVARYFSVFPDGSPTGGWDVHEYSLPLTHNTADATGTRFLSTQTFNPSGTLLRSTYLRYEWDPTTAASPDDVNFNRREASNRTLYLDDASRTADVNRSTFDNLGHYLQTATDGTFLAANLFKPKEFPGPDPPLQLSP